MRRTGMRITLHRLFRLASAVALVAAFSSSMSCTTTYDAYGRPQQSVDPGLALAGVAAAGIVGYAIGENNHHYSNSYHRPYPYYGGGGYGYRGYGRRY